MKDDKMADENKNPNPSNLDVTKNDSNDTANKGNGDNRDTKEKFIPVESYEIVADKYRKTKEELENLRKTQEEANRKAQEEQGKYKELYEGTLKQLEDTKTQAKTMQKVEAVKNLLRTKGAKNPDVAIKLLDLEKVDVSEDGTIKAEVVEAQVKALQESDAYLFGDNKATIGTSNGGNPDGGTSSPKTFKRSELLNAEFFNKNKADIMEAMKMGNIIDDINPKK